MQQVTEYQLEKGNTEVLIRMYAEETSLDNSSINNK